MILQTIKQISCLLCLCCFLQQSAFSQDDKDKPAYTLFDNTGKQISYGELIKRLSQQRKKPELRFRKKQKKIQHVLWLVRAFLIQLSLDFLLQFLHIP